MSLTNGALQIGRSALLAYQSALQVLGQNVTNAGSDVYVRQTPRLMPHRGILVPDGLMPGGGVALTSIHRNVDRALENRLRIALGNQLAASTRQKVLGRIEAVLNELNDSDLSSLIQGFFNSFSELQNKPHDLAARGMVLTHGQAVIAEIQRQRTETLSMRDELNAELVHETRRADELAARIAALNRQITGIESPATGGAAALRDERDGLLRELAEIVQIQVREQPDNSVNVYIGNELFISGGMNRGLTATLETVNQMPRTVVRFADNLREVPLQGGQLAGIAAARDEHVLGHVHALNSLARVLIQEVNKVHAAGQGLRGYDQLLSAFDVLDVHAPLNSPEAGLQLRPANGSFLIYLTNTRTTPPSRTVTTIEVDLDGLGTDDSLSTLAARLDAVPHLHAAVTADRRLQLTPEAGYQVTFGEDSSHVLAALGLNVFFTGTGADDLALSPWLMSDPALVAAATNHTPGDGSNAGRLAELATASLPGLGGRNILGFYNQIASDVAVRSAAAMAGSKSADAIVSALTAQREAISGVSLDEETINMLRFERAFSAAARYTTVVDRLVQEMLAIVR